MNFEIPIVIDKKVLETIPSRDKYVKFLLFWLQEKSTKCVIFKSAWVEFCKFWGGELAKSPDAKFSFMNLMRGVIRPYRKDGYENYPEEENKINEIVRIVNRDYDIVEYLIVDNPSAFNNTEIKLSPNNIITLRNFYLLHEVSNTKIFHIFKEATHLY